MKKYLKLVIGIVVFLALIMGTQALYNKISNQYKVDEKLVTDNEKQNQESSLSEEKTETEETETEETEADLAADFTVVDSNGEERTLNSFIGKPIVLNFWASWCPPCKGEFPDFQTAYEKYGSDVEFVMVNLTDGVRETKETAADYIDSNGYTLPIYYDIEQSASNAYSIYSIPTTYFIDADGKIETSAQGAIDEETLEEGISMIQK
ncbi:MAG: TlpA disulfide reductase family protein [Lachnospiraceae bacterium]|nr:TlpA disulfide reductase family protein [Lachnospiraceae bacterium]